MRALSRKVAGLVLDASFIAGSTLERTAFDYRPIAKGGSCLRRPKEAPAAGRFVWLSP
jgi:hypothetical protein